jgi:hypothetical protein
MGAYGTGSPLFPSALVSGTLTIADSNPHLLLALIQAQLDPNCKGSGYEVTLSADSSTVYVGRPSPIAGALSTSNYGYALQPGQSRTYRSSFPGEHSPVGDLQVLISGGGTLHAEVT